MTGVAVVPPRVRARVRARVKLRGRGLVLTVTLTLTLRCRGLVFEAGPDPDTVAFQPPIRVGVGSKLGRGLWFVSLWLCETVTILIDATEGIGQLSELLQDKCRGLE